MLVGGLLVIGSAAQASAQIPSRLDKAVEGVAIGLQAVTDLISTSDDVITIDEGLEEALDVYEAWVDKHLSSNRQGHGQGPIRAQEVHEALLAGEVPGQIGSDDGAKLKHLEGVYGQLKKQSDDAIKVKQQKSNNGKSEGNNGKAIGKGNSNAGGNKP